MAITSVPLTKPLKLQDVGLTLTPVGGTDGFEVSEALKSVLFKPGTTWEGIGGKTIADWSVDVTHAQDLETANSLTRYALEHAGELHVAVFKPRKAGDLTVTATVRLAHPQFGGAKGIAETSVTWALEDDPVFDDGEVPEEDPEPEEV